MQRCVFLDRDNTIIQNDGDLGDPDGVSLLEGAAQAMCRLRDAGFVLVVITNQSGVARGVFTEQDVADVHQAIEVILEQTTGRSDLVHGWYYSPWHPEGVIEAFRGSHPTRKPAPGMLLQAADDHGIDLRRSWMIGDQERDVEAGNAAGCRSILLATSETETSAERICETMTEAADCILQEETAS